MSAPTSRTPIDIEPVVEWCGLLVKIWDLMRLQVHTWKLTRDDRMLINVLIPSTVTNAKRYSSTRSIICRQRPTDWMYSLFWLIDKECTVLDFKRSHNPYRIKWFESSPMIVNDISFTSPYNIDETELERLWYLSEERFVSGVRINE